MRSVSIHATLAGGDEGVPFALCSASGFYPRHPRGWRLSKARRQVLAVISFYPRHPRGWRLSE